MIAITRSKVLFMIALIASAFLTTAFFGGSHQVMARFTDANGLVAGNDVKVAGVSAGKVEAVTFATSPDGKQYAEVLLDIDAKDWPLHQGTHLSIRPRGVLSEMYVEVDPGSLHGPSLPDGYAFNTNLTQSPVNLDELNNVFDPSVRSAIRTQLQEGVLTFNGDGAFDLNQTLANAHPLLQEAVPVTDVLNARVPQLDALNYEFDVVSGKLAREDANLRGLIANADTTLAALAGQQLQLQGTLVHAAGTLSTLDQGFSGEQQNLIKIFQEGPAALLAAEQSANYLAPLIAAVNPCIPDLGILLDEFVTATGYNTGTSGNIDTMRVDGTIPPASKGSQANGGLSHHPVLQDHACSGGG